MAPTSSNPFKQLNLIPGMFVMITTPKTSGYAKQIVYLTHRAPNDGSFIHSVMIKRFDDRSPISNVGSIGTGGLDYDRSTILDKFSTNCWTFVILTPEQAHQLIDPPKPIEINPGDIITIQPETARRYYVLHNDSRGVVAIPMVEINDNAMIIDPGTIVSASQCKIHIDDRNFIMIREEK